MACIYRVDFSAEGGVLQVEQGGSPDAAFAVRGPDDCYGVRSKDGIKRGSFIFANAGCVALQRGWQIHIHTIVRTAGFGKASRVSCVDFARGSGVERPEGRRRAYLHC